MESGHLPKQYRVLAGRTVLEWSLSVLLGSPRIGRVVLALAANDEHWQRLPLAGHPRIDTVTGGTERVHSVLAGLQHVQRHGRDDDWVLVHDAARPCLRGQELERLIDSVGADPVGGLLALPARDTLKHAGAGRSQSSLDRSQVWQAQTPQMFRAGALHRAIDAALAAGHAVTDEASALELGGQAPQLVPGRADNIKITVAEDLEMAECILRGREA
jgi:2-C-methyl-D-erythritol 4-phosphate cytidylyltransferase